MIIQGWDYNFNTLKNWENRERIPWIYDLLVENNQQSFACVIYSIAEVGMGRYSGFLAILKDKSNPVKILEISNYNFCGYKRCYKFSNDGNLLFAVPSLYYERTNRLEYPILIIDLYNNKFSFIRIINGIHYEVNQLEEFKCILSDTQHDDRFETRDGEEIDLKKLEWFNITDIKRLNKFYFK